MHLAAPRGRICNGMSFSRRILELCVCVPFAIAVSLPAEPVTISGQAAITADWTKDAPGVRHKYTVDDLPAPFATESVTNDARVVARPAGAQPQVPPGFKIEEYATGFRNPRYLLTAPN